MALSVLDGRVDMDEELMNIVYRCQTCGACDTSCKYGLDLELTEPIYELRALCVEKGLVPEAHRQVINGLITEGNMLQRPGAERGDWAEGLEVKDITREKADGLFSRRLQVFL